MIVQMEEIENVDEAVLIDVEDLEAYPGLCVLVVLLEY